MLTPEWLKKMFASVTNSERNGPVFRFFMDLGDAEMTYILTEVVFIVTYVKRLNIPSGVVGACRLDLAYEHFKEKPHLFQFVPNEKQVKAANKLLKAMQQNGRCKRVDGVPVFSAQNLDIAIASSDGIKWCVLLYTPYFFDKNMLDNILEESVDQHFHSLIQTRHMQRRRDVIDDSLPAEVIEEMGDNLWEPPEKHFYSNCKDQNKTFRL
ncbi:Tic22-like family protein [Prunus dulcis]|uniref:Tic22-like family protein n=1 Tax=Prunus dulcis TaxID=3755 RepID=A0A4Y1R2M0_PRUDU|nr:Tic22-like family protein [Prunus dulcis]